MCCSQNPPLRSVTISLKGHSLSGRRELGLGAVYGKGFPPLASAPWNLIRILNRCHRFRGFVYQHAHFTADNKSIEVAVRLRKGSTAACSRCHLPAPGFDQLADRRFEFIPLSGFSSTFGTPCGASPAAVAAVVAVEEVPWATANAQ
jgi:hypothetical protein